MGIFISLIFELSISEVVRAVEEKCKEKVVILCIIGIYYCKESMWEDWI